jgi:hypothetical protein
MEGPVSDLLQILRDVGHLPAELLRRERKQRHCVCVCVCQRV